MFGLTETKNRPKRRKRKSHLEFDFRAEPETESKKSPKAPSQPRTVGSDSGTTQNPQQQEKPSMEKPATPVSRPRPIHTGDNIKRQRREQRAVNSLLNGVGLAFTCGILIVAALASLGGYVLYKQLRDQSASIALLEQNMKQRFFEMETDLIRRDTELAQNLEQTNLRLMDVTTSFEEYRSLTTEMLADLRATNKSLERQLRQAERENAEHKMQIARLETSVRLGGR